MDTLLVLKSYIHVRSAQYDSKIGKVFMSIWIHTIIFQKWNLRKKRNCTAGIVIKFFCQRRQSKITFKHLEKTTWSFVLFVIQKVFPRSLLIKCIKIGECTLFSVKPFSSIMNSSDSFTNLEFRIYKYLSSGN